MNRRELLKLLALGVVGNTLDIDQLLWTPNRQTIFIPSPRQIAFFEGIPYHENNATTGTWLGINRSTTPFPFREILKRVCIDPKEPLYVIDSHRMERNVEVCQDNRKDCTEISKASNEADNSLSDSED